jgi:Domain of Unknown Function with PDB structure (DUF3857)/Transglutaminase-like superfamily
MSFRLRRSVLVSVVCLVALQACAAAALADDWKPIDPGALASKTPAIEKDADAEGMFWEVRVDDNPDGDLILTHYIRIKIFTERGRESQSKVDIPFGNIFGTETRIRDIAARTIKPDGSIVELKKDDVFERTIVKASGLKVKAKSFAIPGVEPGCLVEYRWREVRVQQLANYVRLQFQRDIPVQRVTYSIKPFPFEGLAMRSITLHGSNSPFVKEKDGFYSTTMTNMPAVHEEASMPPENEIKTWMLIYYTRDDKLDEQKYWTDLGKRVYDSTKSLLKPNDDVRQTATTLVADAKSDEEKLQRFFEFCRTKIKNTSSDTSGITAEERKKIKENKSPSDTLKRGVGTSADVDLLFAALATAAGYDARIVLEPDRGDLFFNKSLLDAYFLEPSNIAVNIGGSWRFFNPGYSYLPFGMLRWQEEGQPALITDPKEPVWVNTPLTPPEKSLVKRVARLKLSDDGTLEGDVHVEFTGHQAIERKRDNDNDSESEREQTLKDEVKEQMSTAELSNIRLENVTDQTKPFIYSYHVRVSGYAQRTGKRIFLQPAIFQHGIGPRFSTSGRKYPVYFHYPWAEDDDVVIELPAGYALDNADAPSPFSGGAIADYKPVLAISKDGKSLVYKRKFFFGGGGMILFPVEGYGQLKNFFDTLHKQDNHTVTLKQAAVAEKQ